MYFPDDLWCEIKKFAINTKEALKQEIKEFVVEFMIKCFDFRCMHEFERSLGEIMKKRTFALCGCVDFEPFCYSYSLVDSRSCHPAS